jgi:Domain of unknown function (DUF4397)
MKFMESAMKRFVLLALILFSTVLAACGTSTTSTPKANLRVLHASPDTGAVDILLDTKTILSGLTYKDAFGYDQIDAGQHTININTTAIAVGPTFPVAIPTSPLLTITPTMLEGHFYTVIAANKASALEPVVIDEDNTEPAAGLLRLRVAHVAPAAPAVDVYVVSPTTDINPASVAPAMSNLTYKTSSVFVDIAPADYVIYVTNAGSKTVLFKSGTNTLVAGANLTLVAVQQDFAAPISLVNLPRSYATAKTQILDINALVRVVHTSPDVGAVDFLIDNSVPPTLTALPYASNSAYLPIVSGTHNFKINNTGTSTNLASTDPIIGASTAYSLYVMGFTATPPISVLLADFLASPSVGNARLRIVHASPDTGGLDIFQDYQANVTSAAVTNLGFKTGSAYLSVPAGTHTYQFNLTGTATAVLQPSLTLEAGKVYTGLVLGSSVAGASNPLALKLLTDR